MKKGKFEESIIQFQKSLDFFDRHQMLDKWRSIVLLSPGQYDYREMALANIAFAYGQIGNGAKAREVYEACLKDYPKNGLALSAIKMMDSVSK